MCTVSVAITSTLTETRKMRGYEVRSDDLYFEFETRSAMSQKDIADL